MNKSGKRLVSTAAFFNIQPNNASEHPVKTKDRRELLVARNAQGSSSRHCETNALVASHLTEFPLNQEIMKRPSLNSSCTLFHCFTF